MVFAVIKNEADVKRAVVKEFKSRGHYARRIEDAYSVGFPDLILIPKGYPVFFTEAKIIRGSSFGPSPRQFIEMGRMAISKHSVPTLLGWEDGVHYLHYYAQKVQIVSCVQQHQGESLPDFFKRYYHERIEV